MKQIRTREAIARAAQSYVGNDIAPSVSAPPPACVRVCVRAYVCVCVRARDDADADGALLCAGADRARLRACVRLLVCARASSVSPLRRDQAHRGGGGGWGGRLGGGGGLMGLTRRCQPGEISPTRAGQTSARQRCAPSRADGTDVWTRIVVAEDSPSHPVIDSDISCN